MGCCLEKKVIKLNKHMRKFIKYFVMFALSVITIKTNAQDTICSSKVNLPWLQTNAPDRYQRFIDLENFIATHLNGANARLINNNGLVIVPVVVHILHRGEPEGQGLNISLAQIQAQIDFLNKDFRRLNTNRINTPAAFLPVAGDFNIEFRLACIDSNGNATNGVVRKFTSKVNFTSSNRGDGTTDEEATGIKVNVTGDAAWPPDRYLNIWVCNIRYLRGYSTFPADYAKYSRFDGIVMNTFFLPLLVVR
jgi:hypothetical protein